MQKRGLRIVTCENFGPHKKQFPFSRSKPVHDVPLVTADDDVLYPKGWLARLLNAHAASPHVINAYRARKMEVREGVVRPYVEWELKRDTTPSLAAMATGTSGVIYPPALLDALRSAGTAFLDAAPQADDVWVHAIAAGQGIMTRQIAARPLQPRPIRGTVVHGTNEGTLTASNVDGGQNDIQIARCYDGELIARMCNEVLDDRPRR